MSKAIAGKKAAAFSAAFAIALSAGVVGADATVAQAQENGAQATDAQSAPSEATVSNIDDSKSRSLTIEKRAGVEGKIGDGSDKTDFDNDVNPVVKGVEYRLDLVKPLNSSKDWADAAQLQKDIDDEKNPTTIESLDGTTVESKTTDADGLAKFDKLDKGLYRVTEVSAPEGYIIAKPFLVYVPMTNAEKSGWIYDVHAFPKNTKVGITKQVKDQFANNREQYTYTIDTDIPVTKNGEDLTKYVVSDKLDEKLDPEKTQVVKVALGTDAESAKEIDSNFYSGLKQKGLDQKVVFNEKGLPFLNKAQRAAAEEGKTLKVFTTIETMTKKDAVVYHVPNKAKLEVSHNPNGETDTAVESNEVHTYWGDLNIVKKDGKSNDLLEGATFKLVQCTSQDDGKTWEQSAEEAETVGQDADGKDVKSWTTDAEGKVTIKGIHITDYADDSGKVRNDYCLKETEAPSGYVATDELYHFDLNLEKGELDQNTKAPTKTIEATAEIKNYTDENRLPNTGGAGFIAIVLAGLAIIGGGFFAARRNSAKA